MAAKAAQGAICEAGATTGVGVDAATAAVDAPIREPATKNPTKPLKREPFIHASNTCGMLPKHTERNPLVQTEVASYRYELDFFRFSDARKPRSQWRASDHAWNIRIDHSAAVESRRPER